MQNLRKMIGKEEATVPAEARKVEKKALPFRMNVERDVEALTFIAEAFECDPWGITEIAKKNHVKVTRHELTTNVVDFFLAIKENSLTVVNTATLTQLQKLAKTTIAKLEKA